MTRRKTLTASWSATEGVFHKDNAVRPSPFHKLSELTFPGVTFGALLK